MRRPGRRSSSNRPADADLPLAVITSDLNVTGLSSLVTDELGIDPASILFESIETAIAFLDEVYRQSIG